MRGGLTASGVTGAAIACCALLPLAVAAIGGLTLGAAAGRAVSLVAANLVGVAVLARRHRTRSSR
jgi:hypothetical protein